MAYLTTNPPRRSVIGGQIIDKTQNVTFWDYSTADTLSTVASANYFTFGGFNQGDLITIYAASNTCGIYQINSINGNIPSLVALGGGSSSSNTVTTRIISTGASDTATSADGFIGWNSAIASAKSEVLPAPTTKGQVITVKDVYGNAGTYSINVTTANGTIDLLASIAINVNKQSLTFVADGTSNWMVS